LNGATSDESAICLRPLNEVSELVRAHEVSPVELTAATLRRIERLNPELNCYLSVATELALRRAQDLTTSLLGGTYLGPLHGIPVSLKDNLETVDLPTTAGSTVLEERRPSRPATVVRLLEQRGAVIVGKCHMFEFAYGAAHDRYGDVRNPWNLEYACGGSSNGSAAAVAAGLCHGSIGTDTGGSIRIPAAFCGIVGFKPTYGLVSRAGVIPVSWNLDHVGPMARTVRDAALLLQAIAGDESCEPSASASETDLMSGIEDGVAGARVGVPAQQGSERIDPEVRAAVERGLATLEREGADLLEVEVPDLQLAESVMWLITSAEASDYHRAVVRDRAGELHPLVLELLTRGGRVRAADYVRAQRVRQTMVQQMRRVFAEVDVLVLPTTAIPAFPLGADTVAIDGHDEHVQPAMNRYTPLFNLTGGPAVSVPCGLTSKGLPIGLQVAGPPHSDTTVLRVARAHERAGSWDSRPPVLLDAHAPA
jgi:aspartyl-tRNA(Asn)/glutamyl-tRNA(Gln) amidotransferase subunit A